MNNKIYYFLVLVVLAASCVKEPLKKKYIPSQTGRNIIFCIVNDEEQEYKGTQTYLASNYVNAGISPFRRTEYAIRIRGHRRRIEENGDDIRNDIHMNVKLEGDSGKYVLPEIGRQYPIVHGNNPFFSDYTYEGYTNIGIIEHGYLIDSSASYIIFTRADDSVFAGRFYFEGYTKDSLFVKATNGFFDIKREY